MFKKNYLYFKEKLGLKFWLILSGWLLYVLAMFLPVNGSPIGSLNLEEPDPGFVGMLFSIVSLYSSFFEKGFWTSGIIINPLITFMWGIGNLIALLIPLTLFVSLSNNKWLRYFIALVTILACPVGLIAYKNFSIHYGYYVMCFGFILIGVGQCYPTPKSSR